MCCTTNSYVRLFQNATESIETLRHFVQHLSGEIPKLEVNGWPLWGSLTWIYISPEMQAKKEIAASAIIPGRIAKSKGYPVINPAGLQIEPPVDHISLTASSLTIDLSDLYRSVIQFEIRLKDAIARAKDDFINNVSGSGIMKITLQD